jgi:hypothetical protein
MIRAEVGRRTGGVGGGLPIVDVATVAEPATARAQAQARAMPAVAVAVDVAVAAIIESKFLRTTVDACGGSELLTKVNIGGGGGGTAALLMWYSPVARIMDGALLLHYFPTRFRVWMVFSKTPDQDFLRDKSTCTWRTPPLSQHGDSQTVICK